MAEDSLAPIEDKTLLKTLGSFTRDELTRLRNYILSSYLNDKGPLIEFMDVLVPMVSKGKRPDASQMLKLAFKTTKLSTASYKSLFLDLSRLVQSFLQSERYSDKPEQAVTDVLTAVNAKRLNKLFDINMSLARKVQSNISGKNTDFYLREFVLATEADFQKALTKTSKDKGKPDQLMDMLDEFYIINKLRYSCANRSGQAQGDIVIDNFMSLIEESKYDQLPAVALYATIYKMLGDESDSSHFESLKKQLKTNQKLLSDTVLRDAYVFAINYCVKQVNKGQFNYLRDVYDLYKIALDKKFLYDENELAPWDYSHIMALGVQLRDYKWSEKLIEVYKERIPTAGKKMNVVTFNMAKMYFFSGRYKDVLQLLEGVTSDELTYILGINTLLIKTYYEMDSKDELSKQLTKFKLNLTRRKTIETAERNSYLQFIEFTTQLSQLNKKDKKAFKELKQAISAQPGTAESEWLLEKV